MELTINDLSKEYGRKKAVPGGHQAGQGSGLFAGQAVSR